MAENSHQRRVSVIMAGGSGERFWPLSRRNRPKQLLRLTGTDQTMLEEAVERISPLISRDHVFVITGKHLVEPIREEKIGIPGENVVAEPCKRNTAGCLTYAAAHCLAKYDLPAEGITLAVTTADHIIGEPEVFRRTVQTAMETAEKEDCLVTLGVVPTRAETGYGYIEVEEGEGQVWRVGSFKEKPDAATAEGFLVSGKHFWNSGMFFWKLSVFLDELRQARPAHAKACEDMAAALGSGDDEKAARIFEGLESVSIDYALMEKARRVMMVEARFPWDDVGSWTSLERTHGRDDDGNVTLGSPVLHDCKECIVVNEAGEEAMSVGVVGAEGLVVVVTKDAVLVAPRDRVQDVRHIVQGLKDANSEHV